MDKRKGKNIYAPRRHRNFSNFGVPNLKIVSCHHITSATDGLKSHCYRNCIEIVYMDTGYQPYSLDNQKIEFKGGEVIVVPPGMFSGTYNNFRERSIHYNLILDIKDNPDNFLGYSEGPKLRDEIINFKEKHFRTGFNLGPMLNKIIEVYDSKQPYSSITIRNIVAEILLILIDAERTDKRKNISKKLESVIEYIKDHYNEKIDLNDLADICFLSLSRFKYTFKSELGIPPSEYITHIKIEAAKSQLLCPDYSITDIAYNLGFSTSQYFATVFLKYCGQTPREFRQTHI